jgi:hypothetical protein
MNTDLWIHNAKSDGCPLPDPDDCKLSVMIPSAASAASNALSSEDSGSAITSDCVPLVAADKGEDFDAESSTLDLLWERLTRDDRR